MEYITEQSDLVVHEQAKAAAMAGDSIPVFYPGWKYALACEGKSLVWEIQSNGAAPIRADGAGAIQL